MVPLDGSSCVYWCEALASVQGPKPKKRMKRELVGCYYQADNQIAVRPTIARQVRKKRMLDGEQGGRV